MKKLVVKCLVLLMVLGLFAGVPKNAGQSYAAATPTISYMVHRQTYGNSSWANNGQSAGTVGESKRLESIKIKVSGVDNLGVTYRVHAQTYGWMNWKCDGDNAGTVGEAKRLEAIQIKLTGLNAANYDIYYRVHAQTYGWLDWAKNGESSGTAGQGKRLEAIEIVIVSKGLPAPGNTSYTFVDYGKIAKNGTSSSGLINYFTHVQSYGNQGWVSDGSVSGTYGEGKRLESISISLGDTGYSGGVSYATHVQGEGWMGLESDGALSGTVGKAKRLEAIKVELYGDVANYYDVYYRVHAQTYGWLGWAKNNEPAGTAGQGKRLEAIQIVMLPKGSSAPLGTNTAPYREKKINSSGNSYDAYTVVYLATAKTKAGGKILLTDNLNDLLNQGKITREEYIEYYPYDGAGYYDVFVNVDLSKATTVSGQRLYNEEEIATYISDMLLLETGPYFLIEYVEIYTNNAEFYYRFRCYRA